jgi:signal transduction histidine kinase
MGKPLRVLLLEDSETDEALLLRALRREGYDVTHLRVETGEALREALATAAWDVVLSDYTMPQLTVSESLSILRERAIDIPFIIVSGSIGEEMAVSAMRAGAHDFFLKDRVTRLGSAIERELREAEVRRERRVALDRLKEREAQLEEAVRVRDEFLSIASHELRTPLTPLVLELATALDLVRRRRSADPAEELGRVETKLGNCTRHIQRLTLLINNMLDVTRIASGRLQMTPVRIDLRDVVAAALDRVQQAIAASGSAVAVRSGEPVVGVWDQDAVETAVRNLITNAAKFGRGKPIEIRVESEGDVARVAVSDQGIGIAPEQQRRIFERFERAVSSQHYGGFGLGLWITRQMVQAQGGTVRVSSNENSGSTFVIELPALSAPQSAEARP